MARTEPHGLVNVAFVPPSTFYLCFEGVESQSLKFLQFCNGRWFVSGQNGYMLRDETADYIGAAPTYVQGIETSLSLQLKAYKEFFLMMDRAHRGQMPDEETPHEWRQAIRKLVSRYTRGLPGVLREWRKDSRDRRPTHVPPCLEGVGGLREINFHKQRPYYVYFLIDGEEVVYVGRTNNIYSRLGTHLDEKKFSRVLVIECDLLSVNATELEYIQLLKPKYNRAGVVRDEPVDSGASC